MLVKLAFVVQRLKKYQEKSCHDKQRWGGGAIFRFYWGHSCYEGGIELMGVPPLPLTRNTLVAEKNLDPQPVLKTLVILAVNRVLKFLQHGMNLIFFCNHRLFITVLWTVSLGKT